MTQKSENIISASSDILMKTYAPQPFALDRGEGIYIWDVDGNKYIDCAIGYAVASLGHAPKKVLDTIQEQAAKLMTCQSSYTTEPKLKAAQLLIDNSCFDQVYFSNSGTESVEAALKLARKWAYDEKGEGCNEIIAFRKSFHGRTYGAASVTEKRHSQPFFEPYLPGVHFAEFNNAESLKPLISDKTAAIILEPVQGEGGLVPATEEFMKDVRALCDEHNIALIFDEVQAGMGRLGKFFAYESYGVEPDIIALAKGIGSGFPVGAMLAKKRFADHMVVGVHGTTYGGNPLATAVVHTVVSEILAPGFLDNVQKVSKVMEEGLQDIKRESNKITDIRAKGLMIGIDTTIDIKQLVAALQNNGLLATQAGAATLRVTPPLIITEDEAQQVLDILGKTIKEED